MQIKQNTHYLTKTSPTNSTTGKSDVNVKICNFPAQNGPQINKLSPQNDSCCLSSHYLHSFVNSST